MSRGHRKMAAETTRNIPAMTILDPGINTNQTIIFKYLKCSKREFVKKPFLFISPLQELTFIIFKYIDL